MIAQRLLLKIINETNDGMPRTMSGMSGLSYVFEWNNTLACYAYAPKTQEEIDDMLALSHAYKNLPWFFSVTAMPVDVPDSATANGRPMPILTTIPPFVKPDVYRDYPLSDLLDLARNCGFEPQGNQETDNIRRQLHAYFVGRSWAREELAQLRKASIDQAARLKEPEPQPAAAPIKVDRAAAARAAKAAKRKQLAPV